MQSNGTTNYGHELSWFLIPYLLILLSVLMLVHVLQPPREGPGSSSRSPVHQQRQKAARQAVIAAPAARAGQTGNHRNGSMPTGTFHDIGASA